MTERRPGLPRLLRRRVAGVHQGRPAAAAERDVPVGQVAAVSLCPGGGDNDLRRRTDCGEFKNAVEEALLEDAEPPGARPVSRRNGELFAGRPGADAQRPWDEETNMRLSAACRLRVLPRRHAGPGVPDRRCRTRTTTASRAVRGAGQGQGADRGQRGRHGLRHTGLQQRPVARRRCRCRCRSSRCECAKNEQNEESPYRGNVLVIKSDNLFDEKLTLRHTGDFGGRPDNYEFEWWIAAVDETGGVAGGRAAEPTRGSGGRGWSRG